MNSFRGTITGIEVSGSLSIVTVQISDDISLKAIVIETPDTAPYLYLGNEINAVFKETEVVIGLEQNPSISLQNRINGKIEAIEKGDLLSKVIISTTAGTVVSVISTDSVEHLKLHQGTPVTAMIKLTEMMLSV